MSCCIYLYLLVKFCPISLLFLVVCFKTKLHIDVVWPSKYFRQSLWNNFLSHGFVRRPHAHLHLQLSTMPHDWLWAAYYLIYSNRFEWKCCLFSFALRTLWGMPAPTMTCKPHHLVGTHFSSSLRHAKLHLVWSNCCSCCYKLPFPHCWDNANHLWLLSIL